MIATVKAAYFDQILGRVVEEGEKVDFAAKRIDEVNSAFPGTLAKEPVKKAAKKKEG